MNEITKKRASVESLIIQQGKELYNDTLPPFIKVVLKHLQHSKKTSKIWWSWKESFKTKQAVSALEHIIIAQGLLGLIPERDYHIIPIKQMPKMVMSASGWMTLIKHFAVEDKKPENIITGIIYKGEEYELDNIQGLKSHKINGLLRTGNLKDIELIYAIAILKDGFNVAYSMSPVELARIAATTPGTKALSDKQIQEKIDDETIFSGNKKDTYINWLEKMAINKVLKGLGNNYLKLGYLDTDKHLISVFANDEQVINAKGGQKPIYEEKVSLDELKILSNIVENNEAKHLKETCAFYQIKGLPDAKSAQFEEIKDALANGIPDELITGGE